MYRYVIMYVIGLSLVFTGASSQAGMMMDFVIVGHPGNPADSNGLGAVPYRYKIGKYVNTKSLLSNM